MIKYKLIMRAFLTFSFIITMMVGVSCATVDEDEICLELSTVDIVNSMTTDEIVTALSSVNECSQIKFAAGTYNLNRSLTVEQDLVLIVGAGMDETVLDFSLVGAEGNGVEMQGNNVGISNLTVMNAPRSGIRIENSNGVLIKFVKVDWGNTQNGTVTGTSENGDYALYPVLSTNILVEDCFLYGASDAGFYLGRSSNVIVRRVTAKFNVGGFEISNTANVSAYDNIITDNSGGMLVFDNAGFTETGGNISIYDNTITDNNTINFCRSGVVCELPGGVGLMLLATRDVEVYNNTITNNNTVDVVILNGLSLDSDIDRWPSNNYGVSNIYLSGNTFGGETSGDIIGTAGDEIFVSTLNQFLATMEEDNPRQQLGLALRGILQVRAVGLSDNTEAFAPSIVLDGLDADPTSIETTNTNNICVASGQTDLNGILDMNLPATSENLALVGEDSSLAGAIIASTRRLAADDLDDYGCNIPDNAVVEITQSSLGLSVLLAELTNDTDSGDDD